MSRPASLTPAGAEVRSGGASTSSPSGSPPGQPDLCDLWTARGVAWLTGLTLASQLVALQAREQIFGGANAWLSTARYVGWGERLGLTAVLAVFSLAACGLWMLGWRSAARVVRSRRPERLLFWAMGLWPCILAVDLFVRQSIAGFLGGAFDLEALRIGAGGWRIGLSNVWRWFHVQIFQVLGVLTFVAAASVLLVAVVRRVGGSLGAVDRMRPRSVRRLTAFATLLALTFLTAGAPVYPTTRDLVARDTVIGWPFARLVVGMTDFDGDGYSPFDNPPDTAPFDATRHPYALDVPGDGIDQDLLMGDLVISEVPEQGRRMVDGLADPPPVAFTGRRNLVFVMLETLRYDALAAQVGGRAVMPHLRALIASGEAMAVPHAYASKGFTTTSVSQLFWGNFFRPSTTLIDDFRSNGYTVAAFSGDDLSDESYATQTGLGGADFVFDPRVDPDQRDSADRTSVPAPRLVRQIETYLARYERTKPLFLYAFFMDPHFPYSKNDEMILTDHRVRSSHISADHRDELLRSYYNQVYIVDRALGRLIAAIRKRGLDRDTTVIFMGDHGESLYDDGQLLGHGTQLNDVMTRTILVVWHPTADLVQPTSHYLMRGYIRRTLSGQPAAAPRVVDDADREILQYLGSREAPSQIGSFSLRHGRIACDLHSRSVTDQRRAIRAPLDRDTAPADLTARARGLTLQWEYLQWVNRALHGRSD